jgi:hypothetical protein
MSSGGPPAPEDAAAAARAAAASSPPPHSPPPPPPPPRPGEQPDEDDPSNCPICAYIESGPCSGGHVGWRECKSASRREDPGGDWVERCQGEVRRAAGGGPVDGSRLDAPRPRRVRGLGKGVPLTLSAPARAPQPAGLCP